MDQTEEILTTEEVARVIGIGQRRVLVLIQTGRFPGAYRKGRMWLVPRKAAANYRKLDTRGRPIGGPYFQETQ